VITAVAASEGLRRLGEAFPDLTVYTACIDPQLSAEGLISPGIGAVAERLFGAPRLELAVPPA
jgi:uracil phosphoribosyltransferase